MFLATAVTAFVQNRWIFSKCGLFEENFIGFYKRYLQCGAVFNPSLTAEISQSGGACLIGVHVTPWPGMGTVRTEITWGATGNLLFRFHHVPVSSQNCKRAQRDLSTSVKKCTQKRNQCLTEFSREIGEPHTPLNSNDCTFLQASTHTALLTPTILSQVLRWLNMGGNTACKKACCLTQKENSNNFSFITLPSNLF